MDKPQGLPLSEKLLYTLTASQQAEVILPYIDLVKKVKSDIHSQRTRINSFNAPFIWVFAPSGSGKTQLAYSPNENGCNASIL